MNTINIKGLTTGTNASEAISKLTSKYPSIDKLTIDYIDNSGTQKVYKFTLEYEEASL